MNKNTSKISKKPLSQRLCETLDIPMGTFGRVSFVEAAGNRELGISGCVGLLTYTDRRIVLGLCDGMLTVTGESLELCSFSGGRVSLCGIISSIIYGDVSEAEDDG